MYEQQVTVDNQIIEGAGPWIWATKDHFSAGWILGEWIQFKPIWTKYVTNYSTIVQAGGYQGMYPRLFSAYFDTVYTFEPTPLSFYCLTQNCQKDNIIKMQAALGAENVLVDIEVVAPGNSGMNKTVPTGTYPQLTIDSLNLNSCDMIQLDMEGGEIEALKGAFETLKKYKPFIQVETNYLKPTDVFEVLKPFGYDMVSQYPEETFFA